MRATSTVPLDDLVVTVKELTVTEVRNWFMDVDAGRVAFEPATERLFEDCSLIELRLMCDLADDDAGRFGASELQPVLDEAKRLNGFFFRTRELVSAAMQGLLREVLRPEPSSATPSH